jgi:hypothetical protein
VHHLGRKPPQVVRQREVLILNVVRHLASKHHSAILCSKLGMRSSTRGLKLRNWPRGGIPKRADGVTLDLFPIGRKLARVEVEK